MTKILTTQDLSKRYGRVLALRNLSISIEKGSIFGLLGPNGSGKTTTLGIILDIVQADSGSFELFENIPTPESRKRMGSILETPNFYNYLSAERNLKIVADIKGITYSDIDRVLKFVNLYDRKHDKFAYYSLGMKQRLSIASALLGKPEVLMLDEPTNGLDPRGISEVRELIKKVSDAGITVILASHMLDEVEKVCTHVAIIKEGELLAQGKVSDILKQENIIEIKSEDMVKLREALERYTLVKDIKTEGDMFIVKLSDNAKSDEINKYLFTENIVTTQFAVKKKSLEKQFLEITN